MTTEEIFIGIDGVELFYRVMKPSAASKAVVILVHGHGDHSGGLKNLSECLVRNDYIVYAFDLRGHGKSSGKRGYIKSWEEFRRDLHQFRTIVMKGHPDLPLYIVGHSMGGLITLDYALNYSEGISGIIAIAPAISYEMKPIERFGISFLGKLKPDYCFRKKINSKNPAKYTSFYSDPLRHNIVTPGLGRGLIQTVSLVMEHAQSIKLPLLLQYGLEDKITPSAKLRHFFNLVASKDKQVVEYPLGKHRPFDETNKEEFLEDMVRWLDQQTIKKEKVALQVG